MIDKKIIKVSVIILSVLLLIGLTTITTKADDEVIKKTAEFTSESNTPKYTEFRSEIEIDGSKYKLDGISYEKLRETPKTVTQDKTTTVSKNNLSSQKYSTGMTEEIAVDGKNYTGTVTAVDYTDVTIRNRSGEVSGTQDYGLRSDKPDPPQTKSLSYYDGETGQSYDIDAPLIRMEQTDSEWEDYTYIDIVVSNYTDTQFMFNDKVIVHNGTTVLSPEYYPELLSMAGLSGDNHKVSSVSWSGDSYKEGNVRYRNARANIQAYVCAYTAYYYKSFSLPDVPRYNALVTFKYTTENVIKTKYTYRATGTYILTEPKTEEATEPSTAQITLPENNSQMEEIPVAVTVTTISLILVISLAFVLLVLFLLTKIKSKDTKLSKVLSKKRRW